MTPAAHLQAAIVLLGEIESQSRPADAVISAWFRSQKGLEDLDRGAVYELVYTIMRNRARLGWWLAQHERKDTPRNRILAWLAMPQRRQPEVIARLFSGAADGPAVLKDHEEELVTALQGKDLIDPAMPEAVRLECPDWAEEGLRARFGESFPAEIEAMLLPPPLDLRVNTLKAQRKAMLRDILALGLEVHYTKTAPYGLRLEERVSLSRLPALRSGALEIQDEGSQLVAMLVDAKAGDRVVDFCAGACGKTLAIAAQMNNKGKIVACDVNEGRLKRGAERIRQAGISNAETRVLTSESDKWVKRHKGAYDRVLIDAPCSGTGTWRRNPDARWRSAEEKGLDSLIALQARILTSAARLVKPGGRLVYATCSVLTAENEAQVAAFLAAHPAYRLVPVTEAAPQLADLVKGEYLALTPAQHDTDGFFAAVIERLPLAEPATEVPAEAQAEAQA